MYDTIPSVNIHDIDYIVEPPYAIANKIAVIGVFQKTDYMIEVCHSFEEAEQLFGHAEGFSNKYLAFLFNMFDEVLIYNGNNDSSGDKGQHISFEDIIEATEVLMFDDFDILIPLDVISYKDENNNINPIFTALNQMHKIYYEKYDKPFGMILPINFDMEKLSADELPQFKTIWDRHAVYKAISTSLIYDNGTGMAEPYNQCHCAIYHAKVTSELPVNKSETMMVYDKRYMGQVTEDIIPAGSSVNVQLLIRNGFLTMQYANRRDRTLQCVSNVTPNELDMSIERTFNYMIKRLNLKALLGKKNDKMTYDALIGALKYEKETAIKSGLLTDFLYTIEKGKSDVAKVTFTFFINDIIRTVETEVKLAVV